MRPYAVYILANPSRCLYVGVTNDLGRRLFEHDRAAYGTHVGRYGVTRLVHVEWTVNPFAAIQREKQLKRWPRWRKLRLIESSNPTWADLRRHWVQ